ncbi:MAG: CvpA family protein [Clostridia bacterium]|nr:CvpA family protein [Clostridia bacterium]
MIVTLCIVAILALFTIFGIKKGLCRTIFGLIGSIVSFFLARYVADALTPIVAGQIPLPGLGTSMTAAMNKAELSERSYETVVTVLTEKGFPTVLAESLASKMNYKTGESLVVQLSELLDYAIAYVLCFVVALIVAILLLSLLSGVLDGLLKMPILHVLNMAVGGLLGFATGFVFCWILCLALSWLMPLMDACFSSNMTATVMASPIYHFLLNTNPFQITQILL